MAKASTTAAVKAVIYARYSSHAQTEQSIEGQLHDAYAFADRNGYSVIGEYIDRALTGTKDTRPDFQRMIRDAEKRQFQLVIVWKLDRFARNRYDSAIYKARLKKYGVRVVSVMENLTDGPEGIILEGILESMAEYYSANLAENVRRGMHEMVRKGLFPGGSIPLGYVSRDHHLWPDERYAPIVREIFRRYADGESPAKISADLNARGLHTPRGNRWTPQSFKIIANPVYVGRLQYAGETVEGAAEPLIDEKTFERASQRLQMNRRAPSAGKAAVRYQLQGKIFCGHCGSAMIGECGRSKSGDMYHYYACAKKKKSHTCRKKNERKDFVEWYVCEQTVAYILDPERADMIARRVVEAYDKDFNGGQVRELEDRLRRIEADYNRLIDSLLALPDSARPRIAARMEELDREKADTETDLAKMKLAAGIRLTEEQVKAWLRTFRRGDLLDEDFRQKIIDTFVNCVYLYDEKVVIFYNLRDGQQSCGIGKDELWEAVEDGEEEGECSDFGGSGVPSLPKPEHGARYIFLGGVVGVVIWR